MIQHTIRAEKRYRKITASYFMLINGHSWEYYVVNLNGAKGRNLPADTTNSELQAKAIADIKTFPAFQKGISKMLTGLVVSTLDGAFLKELPLEIA